MSWTYEWISVFWPPVGEICFHLALLAEEFLGSSLAPNTLPVVIKMADFLHIGNEPVFYCCVIITRRLLFSSL